MNIHYTYFLFNQESETMYLDIWKIILQNFASWWAPFRIKKKSEIFLYQVKT